MKKFKVFFGDTLRATVEAERVFVTPEGRLSFFNTADRGNVAGFAEHTWSYYVVEKDGTDV